MNLSIGIVGLPNVGKSTLFNALLKRQIADAANYPFCTIDPNVGVIEVPDERLPILAKIVNTSKIVPAVVEFYDIAGLVKGASVGEGLGNKFLSHIREVSVIVHLVRLFDDENVIHVANKIDPKNDIITIETELCLADLGTLNKQSEPRMNAAKEERFAWDVIQKIKPKLNNGISIRKQNLDDDEKKAVKHLNLLTQKPVIYVFNVSEEHLSDYKNTEKQAKDILSALDEKSSFILISAKMENDVLAFTLDEQKEYLKSLSLNDTGLNRLIKKSYETLGLISFLTAGEKEARAWTVVKGASAKDASGVIHTDFIRHFIKADVISFENFVKYQGWVKAREEGKVNIEGKDYIVKDGDVIEFKIGN